MTNYLKKSSTMLMLNSRTPIQTQISDHNIIVNNGVLFYNMMMQCRFNPDKKRFNNAFGLVESNFEYQQRISVTVRMLAEAVVLNTCIYVIGLAEAPIKKEDIDFFIKEFLMYPALKRFANSLQEAAFTSMGVATFFDITRHEVQQINIDFLPEALENRVQKFLLTSKTDMEQFYLFNLHLPFDYAKSDNKLELIKFSKRMLRSLNNDAAVIIGDFNMDPKEFSQGLDRVISVNIKKNNNILLNVDFSRKIMNLLTDTVDGILEIGKKISRGNQVYANADSLLFSGTNLLVENRFASTLIASSLSFFMRAKQYKAKKNIEKQTDNNALILKTS